MRRRCIRAGNRLTALLGAVALGCAPEAPAPEPQPEVAEAAASAGDWSPLESALPACQGPEAPSWDRFRGWLEGSDFEALAWSLDALQQSALEDPACEETLHDVFLRFRRQRPWLAEALERWVEEMPDSYLARSARGAFLTSLGFERRGSKPAKDTSAEQFRGMREAFGRAREDLGRAIELRPHHLPAYSNALRIAAATSDGTAKLQVIDAALAARPETFSFRREALIWLHPRWGGSWELLEAFVDHAQQHFEANPRVRWLRGYLEANRGYQLDRDGERARAIAHFERALGHLLHRSWLTKLAKLHYAENRNADAIRHADRYLELYGPASDVLVYRGLSHFRSGEPARALEDLEQAVELAPENPYAVGMRGLIAERLRGPAAALPYYQKAAALSPSWDWAKTRLADARQATEMAELAVVAPGENPRLPGLSLLETRAP